MKNKKKTIISKTPLKIISVFNIENKVLARNTKHVNVKNKTLKPSSKRWLERHLNDEYTTRAKVLGYRARSAFKLIEINEKFDIFNQGKKILKNRGGVIKKVLDLGCAPGSWSQVLLERTKAEVIGVDLLDMEPLKGLNFFKGDFTSNETKAFLSQGGEKFDLIISDISPNTSGNKSVDSLSLLNILEQEKDFVRQFIKPGGCFVCKVFQGGASGALLAEFKESFEFVKHFKPKSSRKESVEFYLICLQFKHIAPAL
jgi:23S rRNA (uridine2552-2'-O)-methyltransferase